MIAIYVCCKLHDGLYSVSLLLGKSMLLPEGWKIPMGELHGILASANPKMFFGEALDGWLGDVLVGSDFEIALM